MKQSNISERQLEYINSIKRRKIIIFIARILIFAAFMGLWEAAARTSAINDFIFSSPSRMLDSLITLAGDGSLFIHIGVTLAETILSFIITTVLGITIALVLWAFTGFARVIDVYLVILNSLPKTALAPVLIVWLGNNPKTIVITAISVAVFGSIITLYTGFNSMDPDKIKLITTLGGSRRHILTKVLLPGSLPLIVSNMKVNIGLCLVGVIIGEFLAADKGLGYLIIYSSQVFKMDYVMLSIFVLCIIAMGLYQIINYLEKRLCVENN
ncbi:MAG: ABC transporter permease [Lachnospiraceae bacterium]|nr:ABC transporter permease [Lachnospiraceae bacterium]